MLEGGLSGERPTPFKAMIAKGSRRFKERTIRKEVYSTAWGGTLVIDGPLNADPVFVGGSP